MAGDTVELWGVGGEAGPLGGVLLLLGTLHQFFFSRRRRHTRSYGDWSSDVCSSDLGSPAKVAAHKIEADFIARKRVYDGPSGPQHHPGTPVDVLLDDGQKIDGLEVIFTPGHTRGSISLLDPSRSLLIAGDAARNESGLGPMDDRYNVDPKQHRESIKKLAKLHLDNSIFGHGAPIKGGASSKFTDLAKRV